MKKSWKITLLVLGVLVIILVIISVLTWAYLKSSFLDFEGEYVEKTYFSKLKSNGESFFDRNNNGVLDIYENNNEPI